MPERALPVAPSDYPAFVVLGWATEYGDPSLTGGVPRRAAEGGANPLHQRVLALQQVAGNAAVQRLLQQDGAQQDEVGGGASGASAKKPARLEILRYGSRGESVRRLQERLNLSGSAGAELKVDGIMGPLTTAAVRQFQKSHPPLDVDGTVGPEVWAELERVGDQGAPMPGATAEDFADKGTKLYRAGRYALAFDEFAKANDLNADPAYLFNMAQSLRLLGGRRDEAMKLYQDFIATGPEAGDLDRAKTELAKLRGPGPSGDENADQAKVDELFDDARRRFGERDFGPAYDGFTKAWEIGHDPALLWDRAMALRSLGGQRSQAIALFEEVLTVDVPEDKKAAARLEIEELKGPGRTGDEKKDESAADKLFTDAKAAYEAENYPVAYDEFTKAWEVTHAAELVWDRAQALRLQGGHRDEAIKLYEQVLVMDVPEDTKKSARVHIADLRGPNKTSSDNRPH
jgi:peptidoglycan hydrolase-like protein with peptidoglycan-binding domain